jgi:NSS family neurotransmitter:Na+ symporter
MCLANNSISIIAGLTVMMAVFSVVDDPLSAVSGGSSAITFLVLPEVFAQAPGGPVVQLAMVAMFFLALSFAALTSMISTVELCVRNFVDHGVNREKAVGLTSVAIFLFGIPSAATWILVDESTGVAFPQFLEVQDHIWGYGLMFSGLFIAYAIWKYGWSRYKVWQTENDVEGFSMRDYLDHGVSSFRDDFINTGDNDWWIGKWWDYIMYLGFPIMFVILMGTFFVDMLATVEDPWNPTNPKGITIILIFWGITAFLFISMNRFMLVNRVVPTGKSGFPMCLLSGEYVLEPRPLFRNVPEGADVPIDTLPGGQDPFIVKVGDPLPELENQPFVVSGGSVMDAEIV